MKEIEIKAKIDSRDDIEKMLLGMGANLVGDTWEDDEYFGIPGHDVLRNKECLRIRQTENLSELTYKGPTTQEMRSKRQFWKKETNIPITGHEDKMRQLLNGLDMISIVRFRKNRTTYRFQEYKIVIDEISGTGTFIEIEIMSDDNVDKAVDKNRQLLQKLKIPEDNIVTEPYRDLVRKK